MLKDTITQYKTMSIKAESDDGDDRTFTALITNESIDRDNEVLLASGMNKKDFLKNGIILFNHNPDMPIGTATALRRSGDGWKATGRLAEGIEHVEDIWKLLKQGILKAVSVGFRVDEQRVPTKKDIAEFGKAVVNVISKWTLLEFSIVSVGANQEALVLGTKDMSITAKDILGDEYVEEKVIDYKVNVEEVDGKEGEQENIENIIEDVKKELKEIDIELKEETKEKIVEVIKNQNVDMNEVMFYFKEEVEKQMRKANGNLF